MYIAATQYTLPTKSLDIYISGCNASPHCTDCHNPELWDYDIGDFYNIIVFKKWETKILRFSGLIDNIMIFGGEPLDQNIEDFLLMVNDLITLNKPIWLFTRYDLKDVKQKLKDDVTKFDYIKTGAYIPKYKCEKNEWYGINLATSNQKIFKKGKDY